MLHGRNPRCHILLEVHQDHFVSWIHFLQKFNFSSLLSDFKQTSKETIVALRSFPLAENQTKLGEASLDDILNAAADRLALLHFPCLFQSFLLLLLDLDSLLLQMFCSCVGGRLVLLDCWLGLGCHGRGLCHPPRSLNKFSPLESTTAIAVHTHPSYQTAHPTTLPTRLPAHQRTRKGRAGATLGCMFYCFAHFLNFLDFFEPSTLCAGAEQQVKTGEVKKTFDISLNLQCLHAAI